MEYISTSALNWFVDKNNYVQKLLIFMKTISRTQMLELQSDSIQYIRCRNETALRNWVRKSTTKDLLTVDDYLNKRSLERKWILRIDAV